MKYQMSNPFGIISSLFFIVVFSYSTVYAQTWQSVSDPERLTALLSDTVMEATLKPGVKAVANYNRDGTGILKAWGETFQRTWEVHENKICIGMENQTQCFTLERNNDDPNKFRATNLSTGEVNEITIQADTGNLELDRSTTTAGGAAEPSAQEVAASLANPNTPLASLTFKLQYRIYKGDLPNANDQNGTTLLFQPTFPFSLDNGATVFFRPAIPLQFDQPVFDFAGQDFDSEFGLGDITFDLAYGVNTEGGLLVAAGMVSTVPTATSDELGSDRWTLGPEFLIGKLDKKYVLGAFPNHQWDVGGSGDADINLTTVQFFGIYLPGGGWNLGSSPIMNYDHEIDEWTIPLNFNIGKTVIWNGRPWKLSVETNYYVEQPDAFGPEWLIGINITPVVENIFANWFN